MSSSTINPSIDQVALEMFQGNFHELAQQTKSRLGSSKAVTYLPSNGKTNHMGRIGRIELDEVESRNPDKQFGDYAVDNRQFTKRRFTRTIQLDKKHDINELIKDPTSDILRQLNYAKERVIDRVIAGAATGAVLVGAPDEAATSKTAAQDGVITVNATAGLTYEKYLEVVQNYINNDMDYMDFDGAIFAVTGKENTALMGEAEFINNDYITVKAGEKSNAIGCFQVAMFAGSVTGGAQVTNPVLPESGGTRKCIVLAPESIALAMEVNLLDVLPSATKVNSVDITIDLWINAMRTEGVRVQIVETTM